MIDKEAYQISGNKACYIIEDCRNRETPPFEEVLLSHTVQVAEILSPSLRLQLDGQPVVRLLANRRS